MTQNWDNVKKKKFIMTYKINIPKLFLNKDFIGVWDNVLDDDFCNEIIKIVDESTQLRHRTHTYVVDSQVDIGAFNPLISNHIMCAVRVCLQQYLDWFPFLKNFNFHSTTCLLQKTMPTEGYHGWHSESNNIVTANRTLVWSVYFNNLEESGETEFLYQKLKLNPKVGRVLIFPGSFTHLHRGNPPYQAKYIATGWLASNDRGSSICLI